jgi:N-hydroxyarylamine O-acetyltransferase
MALATDQTQSTISSPDKAEFELGKYFLRIGYKGMPQATLETLKQIHRLHAQSIPFENLNPFLRIPVDLNIDALYAKLVLNRRGGYCFEHNLLLMEVLKSLGFTVRGLAARVLWNASEGTLTPRGHMLLLITIGAEQFVADVGFGGLTLTGPLQLKSDVEQQTPHEKFKLTQSGDDYIMLAKVQGMWKRVYSFTLQENFLQDYEVTSWYLSNHPTSHFITGLIAAIPFENGRHVLRNADFGTHFLNGNHDRKTIDSVPELKSILQNVFGIALPEVPDIDGHLQRIVSKPSTK